MTRYKKHLRNEIKSTRLGDLLDVEDEQKETSKSWDKHSKETYIFRESQESVARDNYKENKTVCFHKT